MPAGRRGVARYTIPYLHSEILLMAIVTKFMVSGQIIHVGGRYNFSGSRNISISL